MSLERETHELSNKMSPDSQNLQHFPKYNKWLFDLSTRNRFGIPGHHNVKHCIITELIAWWEMGVCRVGIPNLRGYIFSLFTLNAFKLCTFFETLVLITCYNKTQIYTLLWHQFLRTFWTYKENPSIQAEQTTEGIWNGSIQQLNWVGAWHQYIKTTSWAYIILMGVAYLKLLNEKEHSSKDGR